MQVKYFQDAKLTKESETTHFHIEYCNGSCSKQVTRGRIRAFGVLLF